MVLGSKFSLVFCCCCFLFLFCFPVCIVSVKKKKKNFFLSAQLLALLRDGFLYPFWSNLLKTEDFKWNKLIVLNILVFI